MQSNNLNSVKLINKIFLNSCRSALKKIDFWKSKPLEVQNKVLKSLIVGGTDTYFGRQHTFNDIKDITDFQLHIPIRNHEAFAPYIERVMSGEDNVLWEEHTRYCANDAANEKSKERFFPITPSNLADCHYRGLKMMLATYIKNNPESKILDGKTVTLTLTGAPELKGKVFFGDLQAIMVENAPFISEHFVAPSKKVSLSSDLEEKIQSICKEYSNKKVTMLAGNPAVNLKLIEDLLKYGNSHYLSDVWPDVELCIQDASYSFLKEKYAEITKAKEIGYLKTYGSAAGFYAFQDNLEDEGMLLVLDNGIFYEFIPLNDLDAAISGDKDYHALTIGEVATSVQYAMVISTNSGLWRYLTEDVVEFTSVTPHKIVLKGNVKDARESVKKQAVSHSDKKDVAAKVVEAERVAEEIVAEEMAAKVVVAKVALEDAAAVAMGTTTKDTQEDAAAVTAAEAEKPAETGNPAEEVKTTEAEKPAKKRGRISKKAKSANDDDKSVGDFFGELF